MTSVENTPPFVQWAIAVRCELRDELEKWSEPGQVCRQLRSLHAIADAHREDREFEGICVDSDAGSTDNDPLGFRTDEVLQGYGLTATSIPCFDCPGNAAHPSASMEQLAGCCGWLVCDQALRAAMNDALAESETVFPSTSPAWYGLWMDRELFGERQQKQLELFSRIDLVNDSVEGYRQAVERASRNGHSVHIALSPAGHVLDGRWIIPAYCGRCGATAKSPDQRQCTVCRHSSKPNRERRRHIRGRRPYWALKRFLGTTKTEQFLARYLAKRRHQAP